MKTKPHGKERMHEFINEKFVCIGWPGIGNLGQADKDEIRERLQKHYNISGHKLGNALGQVNTFVNTMKKDDIVFITERDWAYVGIVGEYEYEEKFDNEGDAMCHRRSVKWTNKFRKSDLSSGMQRLVSSRNVICQYPETIEASELNKYIKKQSPISNENATKLEDLFKDALEVLEEELKSLDPDRRLKAAIELVRLKNTY